MKNYVNRIGIAVGAIALAVLSTACASTGAVPKPFPMPRGAAAAPAPPPSPTTSPGVNARAPEAPPDVATKPATAPADAYSLVGTALQLRGIPYRNGGADPSGFDCSGFTQYVFAQHGLSIPRAVSEQFKVGKPVKAADLAPGDLLFFATTEPRASHVGIAVGADEFVHAPSSTGVVRVEHLGASYWSKRFVGARRIAAAN